MNENLEVAQSPNQEAKIREIAAAFVDGLLAWGELFNDPKFFSMPYMMLFLKVFCDPGQTKSSLILFLQTSVAVSHSTAQRMLKDAEEAEYLTFLERDEERGLATKLAPELERHCVNYLSGSTRRFFDRIETVEHLEGLR